MGPPAILGLGLLAALGTLTILRMRLLTILSLRKPPTTGLRATSSIVFEAEMHRNFAGVLTVQISNGFHLVRRQGVAFRHLTDRHLCHLFRLRAPLSSSFILRLLGCCGKSHQDNRKD